MTLEMKRGAERLRRGVSRQQIAFQRAWRLRGAERRIFVDCGANTCAVLASFVERFPDFEFFAFEPQPELRAAGARAVAEHPDARIQFFDRAVWTRNEPIELFLATEWTANHRGGSTVLRGHTRNESSVDYAQPIRVEAIDFSEWLGRSFSDDDYVIVKMDIEGAEYDVLEKLIDDGTLGLIDELMIEFHQHMNDEISAARHERLVRVLRRSLHLERWS